MPAGLCATCVRACELVRVHVRDMCTGVHGHLFIGTCSDTCVDISIVMRVDVCVDVCVDMCVDMCIDMCIDMRIHMHISLYRHFETQTRSN